MDAIRSGKVQTSQMAGGNVKNLFVKAVSSVLKTSPVRRAVSNIGESVADDLVRGLGKAPSKIGKITKVAKNSDVYTPQGMFKGSDVFVKKPNLTPNQIEGILKSQATKQANDFSRLASAGRRGAALGGVGGAAGLYGVQSAIGNARDVAAAAKKRARGGGKNKK